MLLEPILRSHTMRQTATKFLHIMSYPIVHHTAWYHIWNYMIYYHIIQCITSYVQYQLTQYQCRSDARLASSQWETSLQSKAVSHWLGSNLESALQCLTPVGRQESTMGQTLAIRCHFPDRSVGVHVVGGKRDTPPEPPTPGWNYSAAGEKSAHG